MCLDDDYVHAKGNDKAVPLNSRRRKNGKASDVAWHLNNEAETAQNSNQEMTVQLIRRQMSVITGSTFEGRRYLRSWCLARLTWQAE